MIRHGKEGGGRERGEEEQEEEERRWRRSGGEEITDDKGWVRLGAVKLRHNTKIDTRVAEKNRVTMKQSLEF